VPYEELDDLPESVKSNLPKHAREIYRAAYNSAEEQYEEESRAHRSPGARSRTSTRRTRTGSESRKKARQPSS
jgi:cation transport regulator